MPIGDKCGPSNEIKSFAREVNCINARIRSSSELNDPRYSGEVQLFLLTADKLLADVSQNKISGVSARVELLKSYLDIAERMNRKDALGLEQIRAASLESQRQQEELEARRSADTAEARRQEAAREYSQTQANAQRAAAVQNCVALAYERQSALQSSQNATVRANYNITQGMNGAFGNTPERACQSNPNWYRTIPVAPPPQQRSHCESDQMGGYDCTSQ